MKNLLDLAVAGFLALLCPITAVAADAPATGEWVSLFDGKSLAGWTPKITGYEPGENYGNTFRVEDGLLTVAYDQYGEFGGRFGHLFYKEKFSHYILRVDYRFVGEQSPGGPGWAIRNSGVMLHCQAPQSMRKDQDFPVSIEAQMLGGNGEDERPTANVCTPGTHIVMDGDLIKRHCNSSTSNTFHGDQWVRLEIEVHGSDWIEHRVNGVAVLRYERPQLDETDEDARKLIRNGDTTLGAGYISLQAESHPVQFRNVEIKLLNP